MNFHAVVVCTCLACSGVGAVVREGSAEWSAATGLSMNIHADVVARVWPVQALAQWCAGMVLQS